MLGIGLHYMDSIDKHENNLVDLASSFFMILYDGRGGSTTGSWWAEFHQLEV